MSESDNAYLYNQLVHLGDMMGDGMHLEPGGKWISREYNLILKRLGLLPKKKRRKKTKAEIDFLNQKMQTALMGHRCLECEGNLTQTRSGSLRARCDDCGLKYQILKRVKK